MNVVDVIIIALLILGGVAGFKAGVIKKLTDFIGMFVVIILAFYLKNYISVIMYENLPFFNFFGLINGIDALNILLYEVIAFLVIFIVSQYFCRAQPYKATFVLQFIFRFRDCVLSDG